MEVLTGSKVAVSFTALVGLRDRFGSCGLSGAFLEEETMASASSILKRHGPVMYSSCQITHLPAIGCPSA